MWTFLSTCVWQGGITTGRTQVLSDERDCNTWIKCFFFQLEALKIYSWCLVLRYKSDCQRVAEHPQLRDCLFFWFRSLSIWSQPKNPLWVVLLSFPFFFSLCAAAARYEEGESEAESITSFMDTSNPLYQLYDTVRSCRNNQGQLISEPFFHLPSKKKYPDYYQQIKSPISLQQIR